MTNIGEKKLIKRRDSHGGSMALRRRVVNSGILSLGLVALMRTNVATPFAMRALDMVTQGEQKTEPPSATTTSNSKPMLPNLLLAGTQKAGTTAVDNYMREQDMVCSAQDKRDMNGFRYTSSKEVHFFDIKERYAKGLDYYTDLYSHCNFAQDNKFLIDSTPNYQQHPERIHRMYLEHDPQALTDLKIIFTVREPVAREMSWFNHWSNSNRWLAAFPKGYVPTFESDYLPELVDKRNKGHLKGFYFKWFQKWFHLFDRNQILILAYDEIKENPERAMKRVHEFLEVPLPPQESSSKRKEATIAEKGVIANRLSTDVASCIRQEEMLTWFQKDTELFYKLLQDNPGPPMEQRPFPRFKFSCYKNPGGFANATQAEIQ